MNDSEDVCPCQSGDFTVTKIPGGYLIGQVIEHEGPGPWWQFVTIVPALDHARAKALSLAQEGKTRAWLHIAGDGYEPLA